MKNNNKNNVMTTKVDNFEIIEYGNTASMGEETESDEDNRKEIAAQKTNSRRKSRKAVLNKKRKRSSVEIHEEASTREESEVIISPEERELIVQKLRNAKKENISLNGEQTTGVRIESFSNQDPQALEKIYHFINEFYKNSTKKKMAIDTDCVIIEGTFFYGVLKKIKKKFPIRSLAAIRREAKKSRELKDNSDPTAITTETFTAIDYKPQPVNTVTSLPAFLPFNVSSLLNNNEDKIKKKDENRQLIEKVTQLINQIIRIKAEVVKRISVGTEYKEDIIKLQFTLIEIREKEKNLDSKSINEIEQFTTELKEKSINLQSELGNLLNKMQVLREKIDEAQRTRLRGKYSKTEKEIPTPENFSTKMLAAHNPSNVFSGNLKPAFFQASPEGFFTTFDKSQQAELDLSSIADLLANNNKLIARLTELKKNLENAVAGLSKQTEKHINVFEKDMHELHQQYQYLQKGNNAVNINDLKDALERLQTGLKEKITSIEKQIYIVAITALEKKYLLCLEELNKISDNKINRKHFEIDNKNILAYKLSELIKIKNDYVAELCSLEEQIKAIKLESKEQLSLMS